MTATETITFLREFNRWRRGEHDQQPPRAHEVGKAIDAACDHIEQLQKDLYKARDTVLELRKRRARLLELIAPPVTPK
jgi:serine phosphatase RsbU (regulator of sigma subunit)